MLSDAVDHLSLHRFGQVQQPQQVGDVAARFVDDLCQRLLGVAEFGGEPLIRL